MKFQRESDPAKAESQVVPYQSRLQLERAPFQDDIYKRQYFSDKESQQRIELLQHLVQYSELLLVVSGPKGIGKTTLMNEFSEHANENWCIGSLDGSQIRDRNALLASLAELYELDPVSIQEDLPQRLSNHWKAMQLLGKYVVLLIDNAECLDETLLRTLLELDGSPRATLRRVRILLFGEPGIEQCLREGVFHESGDATLIYNPRLAPLSEQQTSLYLAHRLAIAGYDGESPFSSHEIHSIHKLSGGRPSRINELAHQTLLKQDRKEAVRSAGDAKGAGWFSRPVFAWGLGLLVIAGLLKFVFQDPMSSLTGNNKGSHRDTPEEASQKGPQEIHQKVPELVKTDEISVEIISEQGSATVSDGQASSVPTTTIIEDLEIEEPMPETATTQQTQEPVPEITDTVPETSQGSALDIAATTPTERIEEPVSEAATTFVSDVTDDEKVVLPEPVKSVVVSGTGLSVETKAAPVPEEIDALVADDQAVSDGSSVRADKDATQEGLEESSVISRAESIATASASSESIKQPTTADTQAVVPTLSPVQSPTQFEVEIKDDGTPAVVLDGQGEVEGEIPVLLSDSSADRLDADLESKPNLNTQVKQSTQPAAEETAVAMVEPISKSIEPSVEIRQELLADTQKRDKKSKNRLLREAWILKQDPEEYTLQLISVRNEAAIVTYLKLHGLAGNAAYFEKSLIGSDWFSLIQGSYASREDALAARASLVNSAQGVQPWVRSLASIQSEIRQFRNSYQSVEP